MFKKILLKNSKLLLILLVLVVCVAVIVAVHKPHIDDFYMTEEKFGEFVNRPIENVRGNFIYADSENLIFYLDDGMFVYNFKEQKITKRFDLVKFNCHLVSEGIPTSNVFATMDGNEIHIVNYRLKETREIDKYDRYIIDLKNNTVKTRKKLINVVAFPVSLASWPANTGWHSEGTVNVDKTSYFLHAEESFIGSVKLVINYPDKATEYKNIFDGGDKWGITVTVENVTPEGLTYKVRQHGGVIKGELETGTVFTVERFENGKWEEVPHVSENLAWAMPAFIIKKNDVTEFKINWEWIYGKLDSGKYRISKEITDFANGPESEKKLYYAEFEIAL